MTSTEGTEERSDGVNDALPKGQELIELLLAVRDALPEPQPDAYTAARLLPKLDDAGYVVVPRTLLADLISDRDRARGVAVALEQQTAAVAELHGPTTLGDETRYCFECTGPQADDLNVIPWPCPTARLLSPTDEDGDRNG